MPITLRYWLPLGVRRTWAAEKPTFRMLVRQGFTLRRYPTTRRTVGAVVPYFLASARRLMPVFRSVSSRTTWPLVKDGGRPSRFPLARALASPARTRSCIMLHRSLRKDAPIGRPVKRQGEIRAFAHLGGLHHSFVRM